MLRSDLVPIVEPCCTQHDAHLIGIVLRGKQARPVVEILIDSESGVTSDVCTMVSRDVSQRLDEWDRISSTYTLIVSSPGIETPLKFGWQYKKHKGRTLVLRAASESGVQEHRGTLADVDETGVMLNEEGEIVRFAFEAIERAVVKAPW